MRRILTDTFTRMATPFTFGGQVGHVIERREFVDRGVSIRWRIVLVQVRPCHRLREPRDVDVLGQMMQELAVLALGTCTTEPEPAEGPFQIMTDRI